MNLQASATPPDVPPLKLATQPEDPEAADTSCIASIDGIVEEALSADVSILSPMNKPAQRSTTPPIVPRLELSQSSTKPLAGDSAVSTTACESEANPSGNSSSASSI